MQKKLIMYYKNAIKPDLNQLMCVPYENAPSNVKYYCEKKLGYVINNGEYGFAIYSLNGENPIPLGYCIIDALNITKSKFINSLFSNTATYREENVDTEMYKRISKKVCAHISKWKFDKTLSDAAILKRIFSPLMTFLRGQYEMIWCDGIEDIIHYPVQDIDYYKMYPSASTYFAMAFATL